MPQQQKSCSLEDPNPSSGHSSSILDETSCNLSSAKYVVKPNSPAKRNPFLGFLYTFLTSMMINVASVFVKKLSYISPGQLSLIRNAAIFAGCLPIAIYSANEVAGPKKERLALILRGFIGATASYLYLIAIRYLPLAEAAIILSTIPALTTVMARFYLKETCGRVQVASLVMTLLGVLLSVRLPDLLSKRGDTHFNWTYIGGLAATVGCVVIMSYTFAALRMMKHLHFSVPLLYLGFFGVFENAAIDFVTSSFQFPMCGWDHAMVLLVGVMGFLGYCTMTLAIQSEAVGIVTVIKASMDIIVAMVFQVIFFSTVIDVYGIIGACLVMVSVAILGFSKWLLTLDDGSEMKERFRCLLL